MASTKLSSAVLSPTAGKPSIELLLGMFRTMARIRLSEEAIAGMLERKEIRCPVHLCIGQEAVAAGVCASLSKQDYLFGAHRSHGHYLAKGGDMKGMMAELLGKKTGCSKGRGGSMHLVAPEVAILGTVPIVAATIPMAVGCGLASKFRRDGRVAVSFFGDGAMEEGVCVESLNMAALWKLPVIFVCENNFYASHLTLQERRAKDNLTATAEALGIPGLSVDGNDVQAVYDASVGAAARARRGDGPTFLECRTFRWRGHVGPAWDMDVGVTRKVDLKAWMEKDPLVQLKTSLLRGGIGLGETERIMREVSDEVSEAIQFARESPYPERAELLQNIFKETAPSEAEA